MLGTGCCMRLAGPHNRDHAAGRREAHPTSHTVTSASQDVRLVQHTCASRLGGKGMRCLRQQLTMNDGMMVLGSE